MRIRPVCFNDALKNIDGTDKIGREPRLRVLVDVGGCSGFNEFASVHYGDSRRKRHGLLLVMGHHNKGNSQFILDID